MRISVLALSVAFASAEINVRVMTSQGLLQGSDSMLGHYGHPPDDCGSDETAVNLIGIPGMICAPECDEDDHCPSDTPDGTTAMPKCALQDDTGKKYCIVVCHKGQNHFRAGASECGDATCQIIEPNFGICTYESAAAAADNNLVTMESYAILREDASTVYIDTERFTMEQ